MSYLTKTLPPLKPLHIVIIALSAVFLLYLGYRAYFSHGISSTPDEYREEMVLKRITPVSNEKDFLLVEQTAKAFANGEEVYKAVCSSCHAAGVLNAPKFGDKAAWGTRIAQGYNLLLSHALNGIRQMPARGGNAQLSDYDVARAIVFMTKAAGANFSEPAAPVEKSVATPQPSK